MADNDPAIVKIRRVPVGNHVLYHGRFGAMRQGRNSFPAMVLKQHEDDGSLDLIVDYEAEDRIWEQRVLPKSDQQQDRCWTLVEPIEPESGADTVDHRLAATAEKVRETIDELREGIIKLDKAMYGDFNPPKKSMIEYLADFDERLSKLEKLLRK